jgi:excisionase family DNA binding protein
MRAAKSNPDLYSPAEAAAALGCSEWWIKEQARNRRIPFAWIGGSYRFTSAHLVEIVAIFEVRPTDAAEQTNTPRRRAAPASVSPLRPATRLVAKKPRRNRPAAA